MSLFTMWRRLGRKKAGVCREKKETLMKGKEGRRKTESSVKAEGREGSLMFSAGYENPPSTAEKSVCVGWGRALLEREEGIVLGEAERAALRFR